MAETNVLWFSRHEMTPDQLEALGPGVKIEQVDRTINSAYELQDEIARNDVIAIVAPINLQQQFLKLAEGRPVIMAVNDRVLIPDENGGESKVAFRFNKWEQLDSIEIVKHDYEPVQDIDIDDGDGSGTGGEALSGTEEEEEDFEL